METLIPDISFKKLRFDIQNFTSLRQDALTLVESLEWVKHVNQNDYSGDWQVMPLRGLACHSDAHPILQAFQISDDDQQNYINYPVMEQVPAISILLQQFCCGVLSVRLMKLDPGAIISTHRDHGLCFSKGQVRLHLSLVSNDKIVFTVAGESVPVREGELWYINADEPHSVANDGDSSRIHLVIDCLSNDWLQNLIGLPHAVKLADLDIIQRQSWLACIGRTMLRHESFSHDQLHRVLLSFIYGLSDCVGLDMHLSTPANDVFTQTGTGRAISPLSAARCATEHLRSARFIKGIYQAISDRLETRETVQILYAGTGPFATLLLPLLPLLDESKVSITFLDIHQNSIDTLQQVIKLTGLDAFVREIVCANACEWRSEQTYDFIVSETMKAALMDECQVSVFSNLVHALKDDGILIPQRVTVNAFTISEDHRATPLGEVSQLCLATVRDLANGHQSALDKTFTIDPEQNLKAIMLETHIQVYGEMELGNYECSLNTPATIQPESCKPVSIIQLKYQIGEKPGYRLI